MLLDTSHSPWAVGSACVGLVATGLYVWADARQPGGLTGGSVAGLWFGIIGLGMMILAAALSTVRLFPDRRRITSWRVLLPLGLAVVPLVVVVRWRWSGAGLIGKGSHGVAVTASLMIAVALLLFGLVQVGPRWLWLKGHLWIGLLSGWFVVLHSGVPRRGFHLGWTLETALWGLLALSLATGVLVVVLQQVVPRMLTTRIPYEVPIGQHAKACALLKERADTLIAELCGAAVVTRAVDAEEAQGAQDRLRAFYEAQVSRFLAMPYDGRADLANKLAAEATFAVYRRGFWSREDRERLDQLKGLCEQRRLLGMQERLHHQLHLWLGWHIPLSAALLALGLVHAFASLFY